MKPAKFALAICAALCCSVQAAPLLSEGFNNIGTLSGAGWSLTNNSTPTSASNLGWFQGNTGVFAAQSGADDSYIASNFNAAPVGGTINNVLTTPSFSLASGVALTFWARADVFDPYFDTFAVFLRTPTIGGGELVSQVLADTVALGSWTQYTVNIAGQGVGAAGRFAFEYVGPADTSNYFGIDTVDINSVGGSTVPEPSTSALFGIALLGLMRNRRPVDQRQGKLMSAHDGVRHAGLAAVLALTLAAPLAQAQTPAPGMRVTRDPVTGEIRLPTPEENQALDDQALKSAQRTPTTATPKPMVHPDGTVQQQLDPQSMMYSVMVRKADGSLSMECVTGEAAAHDLMRNNTTGTSPQGGLQHE